MKTKIYIIVTFLALGMYVKSQEWGYVNTLTDEWMRAIWTQGLDTVYIVGENGLIARSTDQGETWEKQHFPTQTALNDIIFIDHYTGFVVGEQGAILKTSDAGETWKQLTFDLISQINAIAATGLDNIWAVGDNSLILHSTDTGETWEQVNILPENDRELLDISFRGNLGYFTGNYATVYKTEDCGITWNQQTLIEQLKSNTFYAVNIMENITYMLYNTVSGHRFFFTENQIYWNNYEWGNMDFGRRGLFFLNDDQGYYSCTFNGSVVGNSSIDNNGYIPNIQTTALGGQTCNWYNMDLDWRSIRQGQYPINPLYIDIRFVNNMLGYAIFGQSLLRYPKPISDGINNLEGKSRLMLLQHSENELLVKSQFTPIVTIKIFDSSGESYINKNWQDPVWEATLNVGSLPKGIYLIKATHMDGTISINKYLIQ